MASEYEEQYTEQEWISVLQDRLAAYEDAVAEQRAHKVRRLRSRLEYVEQEG